MFAKCARYFNGRVIHVFETLTVTLTKRDFDKNERLEKSMIMLLGRGLF